MTDWYPVAIIMMIKLSIKKAVVAVLVLAGAAVAYWLISPLFITRQINEGLPVLGSAESADANASAPETAFEEISRGAFEGLAGHSGSGAVKLLKSGSAYFVRFEPDFKVTNGPALYVHFGKNGEYAPDANLGALKGNEGSQNYELPAGIDSAAYDEVWVWCKTFSVPFAKAVLSNRKL